MVVADKDRHLADALQVIHGDTTAPTTIIVDGRGVVRWTFRPDRVFNRLSPEEVLAALDQHMK